MDYRNEEHTLSLKKALLPHPPPLPSQFNNRLHNRGFPINGSKIRGKWHVPNPANSPWDRLFDEGYRANVSISTDGGDVIYAHASILGVGSPVLKGMLKKLKPRAQNRLRSFSIHGVPHEAVRVFIRFLYISSYEEEDMKNFAMPLLVLSHAYVVPQLKRHCEWWLERVMSTENVVDIFQLALLSDALRLGFICHRYILSHLKAISATDGWNAMKESHPILEEKIHMSMVSEEARKKERMRKLDERKMYSQLYEAMEALVHICRDGCRTIGPHDKILRDDQAPCKYKACKGLEKLIRHFAECKMRRPGGCIHCKRMWQILDLHSRLCANSDDCAVPLCRNFRLRRRHQCRKETITWGILVKKVVRSRSVSGAPFFTLEYHNPECT